MIIRLILAIQTNSEAIVVGVLKNKNMQIVKNLKSELTCICVKKYGLLQPYRVLSFISISINFLINSLIIYFPSQFTTWLTRKFLISTFVERRRNLLEMHQFFTYFFCFSCAICIVYNTGKRYCCKCHCIILPD